MKSQILKFKTFALIAMISFSFTACSDDDEEDDKSFLETHGGTVWNLGDPADGFSVYAQINNNESNPFEIWFYDESNECYLYQRITDEGSPEVIENRENKVEIRIGGETGSYAILTMTVSGDILRVELDTYEEGVLVDDEKFILQRSSDNVSDLVVCPF